MTRDSMTEDQIDRLKTMWADGETMKVIGHALGKTRSAVAGKITRLKLEKRGRGTAQKSPKNPRVTKRRIRPRGMREAPTIRVEVEHDGRGVRLLDLENRHCRWPHGDPGAPGFAFCGHPSADLAGQRPYCQEHHRVAYLPAVRR